MANIKSQIKRNQTNELARQRNAQAKSITRTSIRKVEDAVKLGNKEEAVKALSGAAKAIDQLEGAGIIKANTAARKKSHLQKIVNELK